VIGELWRADDGFAFGYADKLPIEQGFAMLSEFPEHRTKSAPYVARYLFPTFAERIPGPSRPDRHRILGAFGVRNADDRFEVLARTGGQQLTDRIELAEFRAEDDNLAEPFEFRVAGASLTHPGLDHVCAGDPLVLRREPTNEADQNATLVLEGRGERLGYVPRQYSRMLARLLDAGIAVQAVARRKIIAAAEPSRWVVQISR